MNDNADSPFFSIIIPTRNRTALFRMALDSVMEQTFPDKEVIVVNDGSTGEDLEAYRALEKEYPSVQFNYLVHRPNGHGQSYSMNYGADLARGDYLCFLDDDDYWTDPEHLSRAHRSLTAKTGVDTYYTNQQAFLPDGTEVNGPVWLESLNERLASREVDDEGACDVSVSFLLQSKGFAHLNCSIFRRGFYHEIGGMDENIRYECDRDIYIRALDNASRMLFNPIVTSRHNVPDQKGAANMSTAVSMHQKRLYQLVVFEKGILFASNPAIREHCRRGKGFQLKAVAESFADAGETRRGALYAKQALAVLPSLKWRLYTAMLSLKALIQ